MENNYLGPTINTLKAEVDFLGGELTAARAEIARLRAGGCARDQGTTQYCAEAAKLAAENERLRAALHDVLGWHDYSNDMHKPIEVRAAYMRARAALEGRT